MDLSKIVEDFGKQCERLLRGIDLDRPLTEEELVLVRYYCNQLSEKTAQRSYGTPPRDVNHVIWAEHFTDNIGDDGRRDASTDTYHYTQRIEPALRPLL